MTLYANLISIPGEIAITFLVAEDTSILCKRKTWRINQSINVVDVAKRRNQDKNLSGIGDQSVHVKTSNTSNKYRQDRCGVVNISTWGRDAPLTGPHWIHSLRAHLPIYSWNESQTLPNETQNQVDWWSILQIGEKVGQEGVLNNWADCLELKRATNIDDLVEYPGGFLLQRWRKG